MKHFFAIFLILVTVFPHLTGAEKCALFLAGPSMAGEARRAFAGLKLPPGVRFRMIPDASNNALLQAEIARADLIIAADTIVYHRGRILGKPKNEDDALVMLRLLSGDVHTVYTGYAVRSMYKTVCEYCATDVYFRNLDDDEILKYIKTGEPMDKAGAYGIQGIGALLVDRIDGDYLNVVGLPASALMLCLKDNFGFDYYGNKEKF